MYEDFEQKITPDMRALAQAIAEALGTPPVKTAGIANPYKEFTFTVADGATKEIFYTFNYCRILTISATTGITLRFAKNGSPTTIVGAGIGYKLPFAASLVEVINNSGGVLTITIGLAVGDIQDNRFTTSGTVTTQETKAANHQDTADVTLNNGAETALLAANETRRTAFIKADPGNAAAGIRIGKTGTVGAARGFMLEPGASITIDGTMAIYGYAGAAGQKVSLYEVMD